MQLRTAPTLLAAALLACAGHAAAQESRDDRFTLRIGAMNAKAETELSAATTFMGERYRFSEDFDFGSSERVPRIDGVFRMSERQRLVFDYFNYDKKRRETLDEGISYDDTTIPAGSYSEAELDFQIASLLYDYSVVQTDSFSLGLQIGAEWAKAKASLVAEAGEDRWSDDTSEDGYAPVVGLRLTARPGDRWLLNLQGQYLDADWGNFGDYDGSITRANAVAEYRFTDNFGLFAGYEWYRLDVKRNVTGDGIRDGIVGWEQRFKGPVVGVTLAF
ncbi:outer membrane protein [Pseudoxanthomonas suwonensis]